MQPKRKDNSTKVVLINKLTETINEKQISKVDRNLKLLEIQNELESINLSDDQPGKEKDKKKEKKSEKITPFCLLATQN